MSSCGRRWDVRSSDDLAKAQSAVAGAGGDLSPLAKGTRRLRSVALGLLAGGDPVRGARIAKAQFDAADNMTDRQGALAVLVSLDGPEREAALQTFYERFKDDALVIDKWFAPAGRGAARRDDGRRRAACEASRVHPAEPEPAPRRSPAASAVNHWVVQRSRRDAATTSSPT